MSTYILRKYHQFLFHIFSTSSAQSTQAAKTGIKVRNLYD